MPFILFEQLERRIFLSNVAGIAPLTLSTAHLSVARIGIGAAGADGMVLFAGGYDELSSPGLDYTSLVDIYDTSSRTWPTSELSSARTSPAGLASDGKILFVGGTLASQNNSQAVDVYDPTDGQWSETSLSVPRDIPATEDAGPISLIYGSNEGRVPTADLIDLAAGTSQVSRVPGGATEPEGATVGDVAYVAEMSDEAPFPTRRSINRYDPLTGKWTFIRLPADAEDSSTSGRVASAGIDSLVTTTQGVGILDTITGRWSEVALPSNLVNVSEEIAYNDFATTLGVNVLFPEKYALASSNSNIPDGTLADFNPFTGKWTIAEMSSARDEMASTTLGASAYFAGGTQAGTDNYSDAVDIFTDPSPTPVLDGGVAGRASRKTTVVLQNSGDADFTGPYTVQVYAVPPRQYHGAVLLGSQGANGDIATNDSVRFSIPIDTANAPAGTYHLVAMAKAADGTLTPFAGATENFTIGKKASAKPAITVQPKLSATPMIATFVPNPWLSDSANVLE